MNQTDIDRQLAALDEAAVTIKTLWQRYRAVSELADRLETENFRLKVKLGMEKEVSGDA